MAKGYVLINPLSGDGKSEENAKLLQMVLEEELEYFDITRITNYEAFIGNMEKDDYLVLVGGDGTLNRFVNDTQDIEISQEILYLPSGSGNDFVRELGSSDKPVVITPYLKNLPSVEVSGKRYRFINGVGFGIDGYCCQVGD
jgi:diacylglycerol kinase family enzyme